MSRTIKKRRNITINNKKRHTRNKRGGAYGFNDITNVNGSNLFNIIRESARIQKIQNRDLLRLWTLENGTTVDVANIESNRNNNVMPRKQPNGELLEELPGFLRPVELLHSPRVEFNDGKRGNNNNGSNNTNGSNDNNGNNANNGSNGELLEELPRFLPRRPVELVHSSSCSFLIYEDLYRSERKRNVLKRLFEKNKKIIKALYKISEDTTDNITFNLNRRPKGIYFEWLRDGKELFHVSIHDGMYRPDITAATMRKCDNRGNMHIDFSKLKKIRPKIFKLSVDDDLQIREYTPLDNKDANDIIKSISVVLQKYMDKKM